MPAELQPGSGQEPQPQADSQGGAQTGSQSQPESRSEPKPEDKPKPEEGKRKPRHEPSKPKPVTRAILAKNLGKTAKSGRSYKTAGTRYRVSGTRNGKKLVRLVKRLRKRHRVGFAMVDLRTGATLASQSGKNIYSASCLKGPYVAAINKYKRAGTGAGTRRLERETIVHSKNDTYKSLHGRYGTGVMHTYAKYAKVSSSYPWRSRYSYVKPADLAKLWVANYWYFFRGTNSRSKYVRSLYTHGTESFIYQAHRGKKRVYAKPGWYPGALGNVHNDAGIVTSKFKVTVKKAGRSKKVERSYPYVVCLMSGAYGSERQLRAIVHQLDKVHAEMVRASL